MITFITARLVEGRIGPYDPADAGERRSEDELPDEDEPRGLRYALWATLGSDRGRSCC